MCFALRSVIHRPTQFAYPRAPRTAHRVPRLRTLGLLLVALGAASTAHAQEFELTVDNIMRGFELVGRAPQLIGWTPDSRYIYFRWQQPGVDTNLVVYRVRPDGGDPERFEGADRDTIVAGNATWSRNGRRAVFNRDGELHLWDGRTVHRLTRTFERESNPQWGLDENTIYFQRGSNIFAIDLESVEQRQLTDIRRGKEPPEDSEPEGQRAFLTEQQERLFDFIRSGRYKRQPWNRETPEDSTRPKPFYPGEHKNASGLRVTPDGQFVLLNVSETPRDRRRVEMAVWITDDGYLDTYTGRTKVGDKPTESRAAVLDVATGAVTFVADSVGEGDRSISGMAVSSNSKYALLRVESLDDENRWWVVVDLESKEERIVAHEHDDAWLGFPGPFVPRLGGFLNDGETVWFGSERTGWTHLYTVPAAGGEPRALTSGEWEVLGLRRSEDGETFYLTANREGFQEVHLYALPASGGELRRITDAMGRQDATPSPDGRWLAMLLSVADHPPELYVQQNRPGRETRQITESTTEEWRRGPWIRPEIVMITADDGVDVPARLYRPTGNAGPMGQRRAVVFVHGAGYLQNVHNWWSRYFREYMFHHLLAARGYAVLDMDYRASAGHGRDWRTAIYRFMGGRDLDDQVVGAKWLVDNMGVDSTKIGIYGGSYGGFITLMAMFTKPGVFAAGAALRPVTDWAHYNDGYTSGILNAPQEDSTAYIQSSPIYHAEGLEGHLLMAHGMVDDNVLFYDTARLAQRLIELGKENWEVAMYPAERHGFTEVASWRDEYRRILKLFETVMR